MNYLNIIFYSNNLSNWIFRSSFEIPLISQRYKKINTSVVGYIEKLPIQHGEHPKQSIKVICDNENLRRLRLPYRESVVASTPTSRSLLYFNTLIGDNLFNLNRYPYYLLTYPKMIKLIRGDSIKSKEFSIWKTEDHSNLDLQDCYLYQSSLDEDLELNKYSHCHEMNLSITKIDNKDYWTLWFEGNYEGFYHGSILIESDLQKPNDKSAKDFIMIDGFYKPSKGFIHYNDFNIGLHKFKRIIDNIVKTISRTMLVDGILHVKFNFYPIYYYKGRKINHVFLIHGYNYGLTSTSISISSWEKEWLFNKLDKLLE